MQRRRQHVVAGHTEGIRVAGSLPSVSMAVDRLRGEAWGLRRDWGRAEWWPSHGNKTKPFPFDEEVSF
jgi:hypothetical protein